MAQRRGANKWDVSIDGNKFKILKGEDGQGYSHAFQHISVNEQERYSPRERGNMQSRPDLRGFLQTDWSGGQTWFKPVLPNDGGNTYLSASLFDAFSEPGNLIPINQVTQTAKSTIDKSGHMIVDEIGNLHTVANSTNSTSNREILTWTRGTTSTSDDWVVHASVESIPTSKTFIHSMMMSGAITFAYIMGQPTNGTANLGMMSYFDPNGTTDVSNYVGPSGTLNETWDMAPGSTMLWFDGRLFVYNGDILRYLTDPGGFTTATDDGLNKDTLWPTNYFASAGAGGDIVAQGSLALAVATDRGIYYVKNVRSASGMPQARIFKVGVTDARSYIREPIGSLPEGLVALNIIWHLDSLLIIATPDWGLLASNGRTAAIYPRTQLYHYTQGSLGAVGSFDGSQAPSESPLYFAKVDGNVVYIGSDQRMWAFDAVRGGLHQLFDYPTAFASGFIRSAPTTNEAGQQIDMWVGGGYYATQLGRSLNDPKTGAWAAKSYTLVSNYFDFGVALETKQLTSITVLFEKGTANETWVVEIQNDDDGVWTQVASHTGAVGDVPVTTDITGSNITGNRFQYRIKHAVASGSNRKRFRGIKLRALSGETVEVWDLHLDGSEIVNVENVKQDPNVVLQNLKTTGAKNVFVAFIDYYEESDSDQASVDVRVDNAQIIKSDSGEAIFNVRLTKVDV